MYLWVVLATFISLLYGYNLTVRPDLDRVHAETKASVFIAKLRAQDNAFRTFLLTNPSAVAPGLEFNGDDGIWQYTEKTSSGGQSSDPQEADLIEMYGKVKNFTPMGFEPSNDAQSRVYCLDDDGAWTTMAGTEACSSLSKVYLVSWRPINKRWMNRTLGVPNTDFMKALSQTTGYGDSLGYSTGKTIKSSNIRVSAGGDITSDDDSSSKAFNEKDLPAAIAADLQNLCKQDKPCVVILHKI